MQPKVLICDDDEGIVDLLSLVFENYNIDAVTESNSTNIFNKIDEVKPGILIIDLWMPYISGEEITKILKTDPLTKDLPVIIISASREGSRIAAEAGADAFIEKPFDINTLVEKVIPLLNQKMN